MDAGFVNPMVNGKRGFLGSLYMISTVSFGWSNTKDRSELFSGRAQSHIGHILDCGKYKKLSLSDFLKISAPMG